MNQAQYDFAVIGMGVMGSNLLLNMADNGFAVVGYDINQAKTDALEKAAATTNNVRGVNTVTEMMALLKTPRKIMLLVPAGKPVDSVIEDLLPHAQEGDIILDGGNSHYTDTLRRVTYLQQKGLRFMGVGISGGEEGARIGPSIMPGGDKAAYEYLKPILEAIAAKVNGTPCVDYLGNGGAGHYVKMVHNGIEYSIMQLICESYDLLKRIGGLTNPELEVVFTKWNEGALQSFLIEITAAIFKQKEDDGNTYTLDVILDLAGAKGTGKWTSQNAMDIGVAIPCIDNAVGMRNISALKKQRVIASALYPQNAIELTINKTTFIQQVHDGLYMGILISYAQGLCMLQVASTDLDMQIPLEKVVRVWMGGCIIRSQLLGTFNEVFTQDGHLKNILLHPAVATIAQKAVAGLRGVVTQAAANAIPVGGLMAALNYFDAYTTARLPTNLLQAQRDFFGAHTYQKIGEEGSFHTKWKQ